MSERVDLDEDDLLLRMLRRATKSESAAEVRGDWNGLPFFVVVATGANAGLLEQYARQGNLKLTLEQ